MRRVFADVIKSGGIDIEKEYERLYESFYKDRIGIRNKCAGYFMCMPFRRTCISLKDFDECFDYHFELNATDFDIDYLINFCEYSYNLVVHIPESFSDPNYVGINGKESYLQQILKVVELINHQIVFDDDGIAIIVPKNSVANLVSEIVPENISYKIIEYNHHSMKGDLARKQATLKLLADQLEAKRNNLKRLNNSLEDDLFFLFNNLNIRHNNTDSNSPKYQKTVADMSSEELEGWYDRTYDMCLYAFMTLDQADYGRKIKELKQQLGNKKIN